jgi:glycosyltransferase involved in cell wall biosynthesis
MVECGVKTETTASVDGKPGQGPQFDVCLLLEGTYPYVSGGVSTWVHNLIRALPDIRFTGVCILPSSSETWEVKYDVPDNLSGLQVIFLHDYDLGENASSRRKTQRKKIDRIRTFHRDMSEGGYNMFEEVISLFRNNGRKGLSTHEIIHGKDAWDLVVELYDPDTNRASFIDYFWTFRFTHLPILKILNTAVPWARVYHTISTGYAGLMGAMAKATYHRPLLLTEHGIYTKERKIEIAQAEWIYVPGGGEIKLKKGLGTFQKLWVQLFESLGRITYRQSDQIVTLYEGNRQLEIADGADPAKTSVIPNGIAIEKFSVLKPPHQEKATGNPFHVGFVGRVVPIKDVKTFIRACKVVSIRVPDVRFYIMGPTDEEPRYYQECLEMVDFLGMGDLVVFTGRINVLEYYGILDVIVLTSVSEAQPLVILEANCAGIPVVASDVGSCRELLEGRTWADQELGPSGIVTRVADPMDTAEGIAKILSDADLRHRMSATGRKRVETFYRESDLNQRYLDIYRSLMEESWQAA